MKSDSSSPDQEHSEGDELFVRYLVEHDAQIRAYVASLLDDWHGIDEVVQSASVVMWKKFGDFDRSCPDSSFLAWAFVIARYEAMKYRTRLARDRFVLSDDVLELLAQQAEYVAETQPQRILALRECLNSLAPAQRELVQLAYGTGRSLKEVAEAVGRSPTAFYKALARIRDRLHECINQRTSNRTWERAR